MLWARGNVGERTVFGTVSEDIFHVHDGDMFQGATATGEAVPTAALTWLTPCQPSKMLALWNNFHQAAEKNGWAVPVEPLYFAKSPSSFSAHLAPIRAPKAYDGRVVYEGELGIVIGRAISNASVAEAEAAIFGYTCVNDVTAAELIGRDASFAQWTRAKSFDTFGVFGPMIATDVDPLALHLRTLVNGRERQNYALADMIFKPADLVHLISRDTTLFPGDVIACGTSLGVLPMKPGTVVEVEIDGVGRLRNTYQ
jgi:2-keto-4-pentenoate hydratase/2-oxohepta-3-ene-1,7-dioic acid hydratase in catechol pathway